MNPYAWRSWLLIAATVAPLQSQTLSRFTGVFRGSARNASGTLQLGLPQSVQAMFRLDIQGDSLVLRAINKSGTLSVIATWPTHDTSVRGDTLVAKGSSARTASIVNRRSLTWVESRNISVSAELNTIGSQFQPDDYWSSNSVRLTLMRMGQSR